MYKFNVCKPCQLPKCIRAKVLAYLDNKKDDFLVVWHSCGYELWLWSKDVNCEIRCISRQERSL